MEVTPLQVLESIATVGNGGKVIKPTLLKEYLDGEGNITKTFPPTVLYNLADNIHRLPIRTTSSCNLGSCRRCKWECAWWLRREPRQDYAQIENIPSAGKTGTAEYCDDVAQSRNLCKREAWPTHAWYGAYAPPDNPEIAVLAFVYDGGEGVGDRRTDCPRRAEGVLSIEGQRRAEHRISSACYNPSRENSGIRKSPCP